jgi:hypothetical protein
MFGFGKASPYIDALRQSLELFNLVCKKNSGSTPADALQSDATGEAYTSF